MTLSKPLNPFAAEFVATCTPRAIKSDTMDTVKVVSLSHDNREAVAPASTGIASKSFPHNLDAAIFTPTDMAEQVTGQVCTHCQLWTPNIGVECPSCEYHLEAAVAQVQALTLKTYRFCRPSPSNDDNKSVCESPDAVKAPTVATGTGCEGSIRALGCASWTCYALICQFSGGPEPGRSFHLRKYHFVHTQHGPPQDHGPPRPWYTDTDNGQIYDYLPFLNSAELRRVAAVSKKALRSAIFLCWEYEVDLEFADLDFDSDDEESTQLIPGTKLKPPVACDQVYGIDLY